MPNQTDIRRARQTDLAAYLISKNVPLVKSGSRYKHKDHNSLVFTNNTYYWNSRSEHGNSVDYLMRHMGMSFNEAVEALTNEILPAAESDPRPSAPTTPNHDLYLSPNCKRAIAYLCKTRKIDHSVVQRLLTTKPQLMYQEAMTNNIIFPIYNEFDQYVGAEMTGTLSEVRFKGIKLGSKYGYGFNVRFPMSVDNHRFDYALFFESAIDLLSYVDIKTRLENKKLERCILTSMSGLKLPVIKNTLKVFSTSDTTLTCVICIDNDPAADHFREVLAAEGIYYLDQRAPHEFKDWNLYLTAIKTK